MSRGTISLSWWAFVPGALALVALGMFGSRMIPNLLPGAEQDMQELDAGDVDRRAGQLVPETRQDQAAPESTISDSAVPDSTIPGSPDPDFAATAAPPDAQAQLDAALERLASERQWREERRRLASTSPLTPGTLDAAGLVQRARDATDAPTPPAPDPTADLRAEGPSPAAAFQEQAPTWLLARGSVIPAVLETPLDSDLPGLVRAQVSEDVRDSPTGQHVLIPRGTKLVGTYGADARSGQRRLFIAWTDLRLPETDTTLTLDRYSTLGADGASGVRGRRATGLLTALGAAVLFDLAGNATAILTGGDTTADGDLGAIIAAATGNATSRVAERYIGDLLSRGPRFRVSAGTRMNVLVEADMRLPAWQEGRR